MPRKKVPIPGYLDEKTWQEFQQNILNRNIGRKSTERKFSQSAAIEEAVKLWNMQENIGNSGINGESE